jgi:hypothetical protein
MADLTDRLFRRVRRPDLAALEYFSDAVDAHDAHQAAPDCRATMLALILCSFDAVEDFESALTAARVKAQQAVDAVG